LEFNACVIEFLREKYGVPPELQAHRISFGKFCEIKKLFYGLLKTAIPYCSSFKEEENFDDDGDDDGDGKDFVEAHYVGDYFHIIESRTVNGNFAIVFTNEWNRFVKEFGEFNLSPIKNGLYKLVNTSFGVVPQKVKIGSVVRPILNEDLFARLSKEINQFIKKRDVYVNNNMEYKRGILLYGPPGNGKTTFIKHFLKNVKAISIICDVKSDGDLSWVVDFTQNKEYWDKLKIIVLEDFDGIVPYYRSTILNMMDGLQSVHNTIFIATTNFPDKLDIAVVNRPSRFDSFYKIDLPNKNSRRELLEMYFKNLSPGELSEAARLTEGFTGAYFKELFIITQFENCSVFEAIEVMKSKFEIFKSFKSSGNSYIG